MTPEFWLLRAQPPLQRQHCLGARAEYRAGVPQVPPSKSPVGGRAPRPLTGPGFTCPADLPRGVQSRTARASCLSVRDGNPAAGLHPQPKAPPLSSSVHRGGLSSPGQRTPARGPASAPLKAATQARPPPPCLSHTGVTPHLTASPPPTPGPGDPSFPTRIHEFSKCLEAPGWDGLRGASQTRCWGSRPGGPTPNGVKRLGTPAPASAPAADSASGPFLNTHDALSAQLGAWDPPAKKQRRLLFPDAQCPRDSDCGSLVPVTSSCARFGESR